MPVVINIHEAKIQLSRLLNRAAKGEEIIITKAGKPMVRLSPIGKKIMKRKPGSAKGKIIIKEDFYKPLPDAATLPRSF
ncbi:MAG: antitoxin [Spirochaetes bacterium RBG_16_49_21]|nr:MAG: antitoxin [Spirochaetes bacterium RBG_16_49_21]